MKKVNRSWFSSGSPWIWITSSAVSLSLISVAGLLVLIAINGLSYFWPSNLYQFEIQSPSGNQQALIGEIHDTQVISTPSTASTTAEPPERLLIKIGNREHFGQSFIWIATSQIQSQTLPPSLVKVDRLHHGSLYGEIVAYKNNEQLIAYQLDSELPALLSRAQSLIDEAQSLKQKQLSRINHELEQLNKSKQRLKQKTRLPSAKIKSINTEIEQLKNEQLNIEQKLISLTQQAQRDLLIVRISDGHEVKVNLSEVVNLSQPNAMSLMNKIAYFFSQIGHFVSDSPREANTEGGVFPAIFGTVFMVMLMAIVVTPFGVIAAVYLHEYAKDNAITRTIRIAVINLAGVPSIVYGVFGLGFFVYVVGGSIDQLFYSDSLPSPTFGTPGVLWSALTLAILTLPIVIVSTEQVLARIPKSLREGSLALGATQAETLWRIILPMASPAIMTGLILAVARAAGEVAPLMLVGVVKMAPALPIDGNFPFAHLDRKFMHLGFHIYDVGFQSPNVEAARPLVYATALLLVTIIVTLNLTAVSIRNRLREKYKTLEN